MARITVDDLLAEARDGLERLTPAQAREAQAIWLEAGLPVEPFAVEG